MSLPAGFKVNGVKTEAILSAHAQKVLNLLDKFPFGDLLTSTELTARVGFNLSGRDLGCFALIGYREKVDGKYFWGSRKSIAQLRKQLVEPEAIHAKS